MVFCNLLSGGYKLSLSDKAKSLALCTFFTSSIPLCPHLFPQLPKIGQGTKKLT